eukprot:TRINITY_DN3439_c0_g1_i3.p1 TRINITY_DN3439_c0_g1~~TRINITY_DN3439_c0_g1_i3.p1  ORF type:complete len:195 (+),score=43.52 TRINITY_DN3439_c0_g1_i3:19-603(+)
MIVLLVVFLISFCSGKFVKVFDDSFSSLQNWVIEEVTDAHLTQSCAVYRNNPENVFIAGDGLHLKVTSGDSSCPPGGCVYSGRVHSAQSWLYGIFVVTAKVPKGFELWPALWITDASPGSNWPVTGEIDIMETRASVPEVYGTLHCGNSVSDPTAEPGVPAPPNNNYAYPNWGTMNTYIMNWQPNKYIQKPFLN